MSSNDSVNLQNSEVLMAEHTPVLLHAAIDGLQIKPDGVYIDATFGRGGHSQAILKLLNNNGRLVVIDKDLVAIEHANKIFSDDPRVTIYHGSFSQLENIVNQLSLFEKIDGILLDLGVSSPQLDVAERGFSFMHDGPLDMRMDQSRSEDAAKWVNSASVSEMAQVFKTYGEERFAYRISVAIEKARGIAPLLTTKDLAEVVKAAHPKWEKHKHPATRVFQAIRIHINNELTDLEEGLKASVRVLALQGRLAVISFHSLEDRIVKQFMKKEEQGVLLPKEVAVRVANQTCHFRRVGKAIKPNASEVEQNIRSRSAVLRIGEKIA